MTIFHPSWRWRRILSVFGVCGALIAIAVWVTTTLTPTPFRGLVGPPPAAPSPKSSTALAQFDRGSNHRLAILVTDVESGWLGLARGLKARGIPFTLTTNLDRALQHKVVFVYPMISGRVLEASAFARLARHVHDGGSLLAFDVEGGGLASLFGVAGPPQASRADTLDWDPAPAGEPHRTRISRSGTEAEVGAFAYEAITGAAVLARYEDGKASLICRKDVGRACVFGVDLGALTQRAYNGRGEAIASAYVNTYEPSLDVLYDWLADFYVQGEPAPWLISPTPTGRQLSIVLSHDLDFGPAVVSARRTAEVLRGAGVQGTFFMQTKYVKDFNDRAFFDASAVKHLAAIHALGMEIASHSVAHSRTFKSFPMGTGQERFPDYRPFVRTQEITERGSILGEVRISKYLLEALLPIQVKGFRAGYLSNPFQLPDALAAGGYSFDSSITANATLSHYPFQLTYGRGNGALAPVFEFPVTIEDEAPPALSHRQDAAFGVVEQIARRHGVAVILLHPDVGGQRLAFEQQLVKRFQRRAWFTTLANLGAWWKAREEFEPDVQDSPLGPTLHLPRFEGHDLCVVIPKAHEIILDKSTAVSRGVSIARRPLECLSRVSARAPSG